VEVIIDGKDERVALPFEKAFSNNCPDSAKASIFGDVSL
jgi:hypothetical protein